MKTRIVLEKWWENLKSFEKPISLEQEREEEKKEAQNQQEQSGKCQGVQRQEREQGATQEEEQEQGQGQGSEQSQKREKEQGKGQQDGESLKGEQESFEKQEWEEKEQGQGEEQEERQEGGQKAENSTEGSSENYGEEEVQESEEEGYGKQEGREDGEDLEGEEESSEDYDEEEEEGYYYEEDDDYDYDDGEEEDYEESEYSGQRQVNFSVDPYQRAGVSRHLVAKAGFLLELLAEESPELTKGGYDEYDMEELMFREYTRKMPWDCMGKRQREVLVLIVDTSGSMDAYEPLVRLFSQVGIRNGFIEVYEAPNGVIEFKLKASGKKEPLKERVYDWSELFKGRRIVFLGDFDGGDLVIRASWHNHLIWLCTEERYEDTTDHSWNTLPLSKFKGQYYKITQPQDIPNVLKQVLKHGFNNFSRKRLWR